MDKNRLARGVGVVAIATYTVAVPGEGAQPRSQSAHRTTLSCREALNILSAISSQESAASDRIVRTAPEFPNAIIMTQSGRTQRIRAQPDSGIWKHWAGAAPSKDLISRWFAEPYRSVGICLRRGDDSISVDSLPGWKGAKRTTDEAMYDIQATYPVVNAASSRALVVYSKGARAGLGGSSQLFLLQRFGAKWRIIGSRLLTIS